MKKVYWYIKDNWIWYVAGFVILGITYTLVQEYLNSHYTEDIECTVVSAETTSRSTGSGGKVSSSIDSTVETEECGELGFDSPVIDGLSMKEVTDQLVPGKKYRFTVGRYVFFNNSPNVRDIKNMDGSPVDFAP